MKRRTFLKTAAALSATTLFASGPFLTESRAADPEKKTNKPPLSNVKGPDYFLDTLKAVELIGGMSRFVKPGATVGLLANNPRWWKRPGSHTSTEVVLATAQMVREAGAGKIVFLIQPAPGFWERSPRSSKFKELTDSIANPSDKWVEKDISRGVSLKRARMIADLFECDTFINIPVAKQHEGVHMTACLKNMMGACHPSTNEFFHTGGGGKKDYEDVVFLSQCIADVNLVRKPDLCIVDATEFLVTGGPAGPGEIRREQRVLAGTDPVQLDARCAAFFDRKPEDILSTKLAAAHGIGSLDFSSVELKEAVLG